MHPQKVQSPTHKTKEIKLPLVSIITVNFCNEKVTKELLESIHIANYPALEVIIVDNGSLKDYTAEFKAIYPSVKVLISKKNLGFAGANNVGILEAKGDYIYLVNNDTEFTAQTIHPLVKRLENNPTIGAISPKIHYFFHPNTIQYAGLTAINPMTGRNKMIGHKQKDAQKYNACYPTDFAHGAAMMIPRKVIKEVGLMPTDYFLYYEELDWCETMKKANYQIYYEGHANILHKESISTGKNSPLKMFYQTRNRLWFMKRHYPKNTLLFKAFIALFILPKNVVKLSILGDWNLLKAFMKGLKHGLK